MTLLLKSTTSLSMCSVWPFYSSEGMRWSFIGGMDYYCPTLRRIDLQYLPTPEFTKMFLITFSKSLALQTEIIIHKENRTT